MNINKRIFLMTLVLGFAVLTFACQSDEEQEQRQDANSHVGAFPEQHLDQEDNMLPTDENLAIAAIHNAVDDSVVPLAGYDYETHQLIRYNWHLDTGEITNTGLVILSQIPVGFWYFNWDGGSYIAVEDYDQQIKAGSGISIAYKDSRNPGYKDYMIKNFPYPKDKFYFNYCVNLEPIIISNGIQEHQFDFTDIVIPGGNEDAYAIISFCFNSDIAYFLLYPLLDNTVEQSLVIIEYDMELGTYGVNMVIDSPKFTHSVPPSHQYISAIENGFLVCNFLDGLYEIEADTYTAKKIYDNHDFVLENIEEEDRVWIQSANYYNGYLLLTINQYRFADDGSTDHFIVLKEGEIISQIHEEEGTYYLPNL